MSWFPSRYVGDDIDKIGMNSKNIEEQNDLQVRTLVYILTWLILSTYQWLLLIRPNYYQITVGTKNFPEHV